MDSQTKIIAFFYFFVLPFICFLISLTIFLAAIGKSLGIRKYYIKIILRIIEFGQEKISKYNLQMKRNAEESEDETDQEEMQEKKNVIRRDISLSVNSGVKLPSRRPDYDTTNFRKEFCPSDIMYFAKCGMEAIIEDEVTSCFTAEELHSWNFLTRTTSGHQFISVRLTILWCLGFVFRYGFLLPFRFFILFVALSWLLVSTFVLKYLPSGDLRRKLARGCNLMTHRMLARAASAVIRYHNRENKAKNGICVANHTSPIDVIILSADGCYALVGQAHQGFLGFMQRTLSGVADHIWFERSEVKDRSLVAKRLREHVEDKTKLPILIFPEGTCINNTSVVMFKKGSFEVSSTIYPVAIKYDPRFGDAFWDSSKMGMMMHMFHIFTSWALVADVWYLPPMTKQENEDAVQFANRVKREIAKQGGLVDLEWDGQLKRMKAKDSWKSKPQEDFSKLLKIE